MVLHVDDLRVNRTLRKALRKRPYEIRLDTSFSRVIRACARTPRPGQDGTWITRDMARAYNELHRLGFAHCAETWHEGKLVGGLYGVSIGGGFFGESMFSHASDASKIAFITLIRQLKRWSIELVDCQIYTEYLATFGAQEWERSAFLWQLHQAISQPTRRGPWTLDADLAYPPHDAT